MRLIVVFIMLLAATQSVASDYHRATAAEKRLAIQWASEEPGYAARKYKPGIDYPAVVRRCLARDRSSFRSLFAVSASAQNAAAELQAGILAIVLKQVGDDFFFSQLATSPKASRTATIALLKFELLETPNLEKSPPPFKMHLDDYPKIIRLLAQSNQALERTDSAVHVMSAFELDFPPRRSLSLGRWYGC